MHDNWNLLPYDIWGGWCGHAQSADSATDGAEDAC